MASASQTRNHFSQHSGFTHGSRRLVDNDLDPLACGYDKIFIHVAQRAPFFCPWLDSNLMLVCACVHSSRGGCSNTRFPRKEEVQLAAWQPSGTLYPFFPKQSIVGVLNSFKDCRHFEDCCQVLGSLSPFVSLHVGVFAGLLCFSPPLVSLRLPLSPVVSRRLYCFFDVPFIVCPPFGGAIWVLVSL